MPELPEVEVLKKSLSRLISNTKINKIKIKNKNLRYKITKSFQKKLKNNFISRITRRSKYIIFELQNKDRLLIHLGMSGIVFLIRNTDKKKIKTSFYYNLNILPKHNHIYIYLNNGYILVYNDIRRFGFLKIISNRKFIKNSFLLKLGPEPLSKFFNYSYFKKYIVNKKKNIKQLLMDQSFVSGLGNIYVNEILFASKINPTRSCQDILKKEINILINNTKNILKKSILSGGSSIKDFKNTSGQIGQYQENFKVYGRHNFNCPSKECRGQIKRVFISGRSTFFCSKCQK